MLIRRAIHETKQVMAATLLSALSYGRLCSLSIARYLSYTHHQAYLMDATHLIRQLALAAPK